MTDDVTQRLLAFIRQRFVPDELKGKFDEHSPLLEWGIIDSLGTALLISFIRRELGVRIPPRRINPTEFRDVHRLAAMVHELTPVTS